MVINTIAYHEFFQGATHSLEAECLQPGERGSKT